MSAQKELVEVGGRSVEYCGDIKWLDTQHSCNERVQHLVNKKYMSHRDAKISLLETNECSCSNPSGVVSNLEINSKPAVLPQLSTGESLSLAADANQHGNSSNDLRGGFVTISFLLFVTLVIMACSFCRHYGCLSRRVKSHCCVFYFGFMVLLSQGSLLQQFMPRHAANERLIDAPYNKIYNPDNSTKAQLAYDERPHGHSGYLCVYGAKGRLNNLIIQNLIGIYMARQLNRTLLADAEVSKFYDIERLSLVYPDWDYKPIIPITDTNFTCQDPQTQSPYTLNRQFTILERIEDYHNQTSTVEVAAIHNNDIWYWLGRPPEEIYERFFRALVPKQIFRTKVQTFLDQHKLRPFSYNAVHLRFLEGYCGRFADLCCPKLEYVLELIIERGGTLSKPIFVATDRQCPEEVIATYTANSTDSLIIMGYTGPCEGTECAVLDFELLVLSDVFIGNIISSVSMNVREGRLARYGKPGLLSVLSNEKKTLDLEKTVQYLTRYWIGYWEFRKTCDQLPPRKRASAPCV